MDQRAREVLSNLCITLWRFYLKFPSCFGKRLIWEFISWTALREKKYLRPHFYNSLKNTKCLLIHFNARANVFLIKYTWREWHVITYAFFSVKLRINFSFLKIIQQGLNSQNVVLINFLPLLHNTNRPSVIF